MRSYELLYYKETTTFFSRLGWHQGEPDRGGDQEEEGTEAWQPRPRQLLRQTVITYINITALGLFLYNYYLYTTIHSLYYHRKVLLYVCQYIPSMLCKQLLI